MLLRSAEGTINILVYSSSNDFVKIVLVQIILHVVTQLLNDHQQFYVHSMGHVCVVIVIAKITLV